ncbi:MULTISPECIES: hypothetical protein [unclassified Modestobacter]|uniref:hypothetical protein n=1 Tax=unclassified Modestobacter TaxID=2643866 RepID=UPI0022AA7AE6|nr:MULTISPECIES: hypothetical protein [unclassified Modestobacter]MCZ2826049.1 hypothetical protein [Modestobacter sp. VKM Ac-2981]MCZ2852886.1 hypothetical protein [Modestobacter sp. VKM Ac-2982]
MTLRLVRGGELSYHLLAFDEDGRPRRETAPSSAGGEVCEAAADPKKPITDVFIFSHGWLGDVRAAVRQYDSWLTAMDHPRDLTAAQRSRPDFRPLMVGLHWPSLPWGDERLHRGPALLSGDDGASNEFASENATDVDTLIDAYARRIADTPAGRTALRTILSARPTAHVLLPQQVEDAYRVLFAESGLACDGMSGAPGADQDSFDPGETLAQSEELDRGTGPALLGGSVDRSLNLLRMPLRQLSFWKMKDRARRFGEGGAHRLLRELQEAAPGARFHLMGHSFGCIVVSGAVSGPPDSSERPRPVATLFLVQGALSLWAYADHDGNPYQRATPGYFRRLLADRLVLGPVVTTRSTFDTAVGCFYPVGARLARQKVLGAALPKYGSIGSFGIQGVRGTVDIEMVNDRQYYDYAPGRVYNLEASRVIRQGRGPAGAHSDIAHAAVAHAFWQAAARTE